MAAAQLAAALTHERTDDRDAVRLLGQAALTAPGWRSTRAAPGEWSPAALGWGPLYEPHRHPAGAELGRRLCLRSGRYLLELSAEGLAPDAAPAILEVISDRPGAPARRVPLAASGDGFAASFEVHREDAAVDLRLRGGGPILLKAVRLKAVRLKAVRLTAVRLGAQPSNS
jgi:hypothetical protein